MHGFGVAQEGWGSKERFSLFFFIGGVAVGFGVIKEVLRGWERDGKD